MSFIAAVAKVVTAVQEIQALKVALGYPADASVADIIASIKKAHEQIKAADSKGAGV